MTTLQQAEFLKKFSLAAESVSELGLDWDVLVAVFEDHKALTAELDRTAQDVANRMRATSEVHSLRYRIKDPEHLIEKIFRKKRENPALEISVDNYPEHIQDLAGVRAMHLFKADWLPIHRHITATWDLLGVPQANVRAGDPDNIVEKFKEMGCEVRKHPQGYRSVHYQLKVRPTKKEHTVELQVRTLFEEGWSEIDHRFAYPHSPRGKILSEFLAIFNRLAGSADEMGSFVAALDQDIAEREERYREVAAQHEKSVQELRTQVQQLEITEGEKKSLEKQIKKLEAERPNYQLFNLGEGVTLNAGTILTSGLLGGRTVGPLISMIGGSAAEGGILGNVGREPLAIAPKPKKPSSKPR